MSQLLVRDFLRALSRAGQQMLRGDRDPSSQRAAAEALLLSAQALTATGEAVLNVVADAFYLERDVLANASTEFDSLLQAMKERRIDSITILPGAQKGDLLDLAGLLAGHSEDLPAEGSVLLNAQAMDPSDVEMRPLSHLRRTYADSLDALREVSRHRVLHLGEVVDVVDQFLAGGAAEPGSSLLMATVHNHDELTYYHSINVCLLSLALGRFSGLADDRLRMLGLSALLHDVGRVVVDENALNQPGRLSNEDWAQVRLHPQEGAMAILAAAGPGEEIASAVALEHHVRMDGGGYPDVRRPTHLYSRIVAISDTYEAITSHRPYRPARTPNEALRILLEGAGAVHDGDLVRLFIEMVGTYPAGSLLRLDGGETVVVVPSNGSGSRGIVVREADGALAEDRRSIEFSAEDVAGQLLPDEAGVDPGSVLEVAEQGDPARR